MKPVHTLYPDMTWSHDLSRCFCQVAPLSPGGSHATPMVNPPLPGTDQTFPGSPAATVSPGARLPLPRANLANTAAAVTDTGGLAGTLRSASSKSSLPIHFVATSLSNATSAASRVSACRSAPVYPSVLRATSPQSTF